MSDAPERITAFNEHLRGHSFTARGGYGLFGPVEYIRADVARAERDAAVANEYRRGWVNGFAARDGNIIDLDAASAGKEGGE